ncbi:hypothetical protein HW132_34940 [Brasilonema sp. CT11]|nr:hypothetical protein [Brasilonema sp. CT11]
MSTVTETIAETINDVIAKLQTVTDEESIKEIVTSAWLKLKAGINSDSTFVRKVRAPLRKAIVENFPTTESAKPGYYQTEAGKNKNSRWEHLGLWYATTNENRWNVVGDEARAQYYSNLPPLPQTKQIEPVDQAEQTEQTEQAEQVEQVELVDQAELTTIKLEDMTLNQLEFDVETQQVLADALVHSGMSLADFIKQACKVYAKTLEGKAKQYEDDLTTVSTEELVNVSQEVAGKEIRNKYFTHPKRAEELTKRAIAAIQQHNTNATEKTQRWCITQTAVQALTGSRPKTVGEILARFKTMVDDHNQKYELKPYDNRKGNDRKIEHEINLITLVPNGLS